MTTVRKTALAIVAAIGAALSCAAFAEAPGVAASGSAGATSTLPGPASQPGTGEPPASLNLGRQGAPAGTATGGGRITEEQVRRSMEAAGYTDVDISREGDDWVARGMLNGASQRIRIDPRTGRTKP